MQEIELNLDNIQRYGPRIKALVEKSKFLAAVTGAGISKASGLPLVSDRIQGVSLRDFFAETLFKTDPARYYEVFRSVFQSFRSAIPNRAHTRLAEAGVWVITQNVDGLHRDAGTRHLIEMHGNFRELRCVSCGRIYASSVVYEMEVPQCSMCERVLTPGIVLDGQEIRHFSLAVDWVGRAELLFIIGTKLEMDPVRQLPQMAINKGIPVIRVNHDAELVLPRIF
jgi:NAD-dependent deacetylase